MSNDLAAVESFLVSAVQRRVPIDEDDALTNDAKKFVTGNDRLRPAEQVDIYRRQYFARLREVLGNEFPGTARILGHEGMDKLVRAFVDVHPPKAPLFLEFYAPLPAFVTSWGGFVSSEQRAIAIEMARYELALTEMHGGPDEKPLDAQKLASLPEDAWEKARIVLQPVFRQYVFHYPVHKLLKAWLSGEDLPIPTEPLAAPAHVALYRASDHKTHFEDLEPEAFALLAALHRGTPLVPALGEVTESLDAERQEHVGASVGRWFQQWTAWGIVVDVVLE